MNSVKHLKAITQKSYIAKDDRLLNAIIIQAIYFLLGFVSAKSTIFGEYIPFSVALIASIPLKSIAFCLGGVIVGCFVPFIINESFRYIATCITIVAIRWILNDLEILKSKSAFNIILAIFPLLVTGFAIVFSESTVNINLIVMYATEALISGATAYFFSKTVEIIYEQNAVRKPNQQELVCIIFSCCVMLLSLANINIGGVSLGRVLVITAVLYCAYFGSVEGGAVSGIMSGVIFGMQTTAINHITGAYAFGGLIAGIFSKLGKSVVALTFIIANAVLAFQNAGGENIIEYIFEACIASIIFLIIPKKSVKRMQFLFTDGANKESFNSIKENLIMRLDFSAKTVASISDTVDNVARKMKAITDGEPENIHKRVEDKLCEKCKLKNVCWHKEYHNTVKAIKGVITALKSGQKASIDKLPRELVQRCPKIQEILKQIKDEYQMYLVNLQASRHIDRIREILDNQLYTMGEMLSDISEEAENFDDFLPQKSERIKRVLKENKIAVIRATCRCNESGHIIAEMQVCGRIQDFTKNKPLLNKIEEIFGCKTDKPMISFANGYSKIQICEETELQIDYACKQHVCENKALCGDSFKSFNDGMGHSVFILSDGMGSGGRAAVDGAMASGIAEKLLRSGIRYGCVLNIVNSALLVKSGEESFATLDIIIINMFTGETKLIKAGAAQTYIKQGTEVYKLENPGLPLGILSEVSYSKSDFELSDGDKVLMLSDGVSMYGEKWIEKRLLEWENEDENKVAEDIITEATLRRKGTKDDDITVVAVNIKDNQNKLEDEGGVNRTKKEPKLLVKA